MSSHEPAPPPADPTGPLDHPALTEHIAIRDEAPGHVAADDGALRAEASPGTLVPSRIAEGEQPQGTLADRIRARREGSR